MRPAYCPTATSRALPLWRCQCLVSGVYEGVDPHRLPECIGHGHLPAWMIEGDARYRGFRGPQKGTAGLEGRQLLLRLRLCLCLRLLLSPLGASASASGSRGR